MKIFFFTILFFFQIIKGFSQLNNAPAVLIKENTIDSIIVFRANYRINMPMAVCCEDIFKIFEIKKERVFDEDTIKLIVQELNNLSLYESDNADTCIDTRAMIYIYLENGTREKMCIGTTKHVIFSNREMILANRNLINVVFRLKE